MIDLVCLLADKSIEAAMDAVLRRPEALGIRAIEFETVVHPRRDPNGVAGTSNRVTCTANRVACTSN